MKLTSDLVKVITHPKNFYLPTPVQKTTTITSFRKDFKDMNVNSEKKTLKYFWQYVIEKNILIFQIFLSVYI